MLELSIIPAIIPQSPAHLREAIEKIAGVAREIQIDIVDETFIPDMCWGTALPYELDLMIANPLATLPLWLAQNPKSVVLHIESFKSDADVMSAIEMVRAPGRKVVLASLNDTPLARLLAFVSHIDGIQCMGIAEIGRQGNPFDTRVLDRIQSIRHAHPTLPISVDGSVNKDTIGVLKEAGANRFVVGSAIFDSDNPINAYRQLCALV